MRPEHTCDEMFVHSCGDGAEVEATARTYAPNFVRHELCATRRGQEGDGNDGRASTEVHMYMAASSAEFILTGSGRLAPLVLGTSSRHHCRETCQANMAGTPPAAVHNARTSYLSRPIVLRDVLVHWSPVQQC